MSDAKSPVFGRHQRKIDPRQIPSADTFSHANNMNGAELGPDKLAVTEWQALHTWT